MTAIGKVSLALAGALLGISVYVHFTIGFWGDQDWELLVAGMLLDGKKLYFDHLPVNPPLIFWLYTFPAALSRVTGLQDFQALVLLFLGIVALVVTTCCRLLDFHPAFTGNGRKRVELVVLLSFLFVFRIASAYFADREHIFLLLIFPYLLRWMPSLSHAQIPGRMRVLIGSLAGIGFCIKPQCFVLFAGIQLLCYLRKNRPPILSSLENRIIYGIGAAYLLAIGLFTPSYFTLVLPMSVLTYGVISAGPARLFDFTIFITLFLTFFMFRPKHRSLYRQDIYYLLLASLFLLGYGLLGNGWGYTYQPVITLLLFINGFVLWEFLYLKDDYAAHARPVWPFWLGACACLFNFASKTYVALLYIFTFFHFPCHGDKACPGYYAPFVSEVKASSAPHSFGMIGMNFALWAHVSKLSGAPWETRFSQMWMIPKFIISGPDFVQAHEWILYYTASALAEDLERNKPQVVFVDRSETIYTIQLSKPFDWIASFRNFINFRDAWEHYTYIRTIDRCDALEPSQAVGLAMMGKTSLTSLNCRYDVYYRQR